MTAIRMQTVLLLACLAGCGFQERSRSDDSSPPAAAEKLATPNGPAVATSPARIEKLKAEHLPNPVRVHAKVISGGLPEGEAAFAELKELGVKTVISVDGAKPDVATAEKYGMRYVHLPHGYDGIPADRAKELAKAVRELPGTVYIHCHHGKHRSPAAAAVACVGAGLIGRDDAAMLLKVAGTSENYRGLFQSADKARTFDKALLDELQAVFPAVARLSAMAEVMVEIEHVHDRLKTIEKAGWKTPADNPDLIPAHEALLLREHFTELLRTGELQEKPVEFQELTKEAETIGLALEEALNASPDDTEKVSKLFLAVGNNCKTCHQKFRDVPLNEKAGSRK